MPRKPRVRSRHAPSSSGASGSTPRRAGPARRRESQVFWQCQSCGAPVEPQFGVGDDSWCPSCQAVGTVAGMEGQYPSPLLYGAWAARQARQKEQEKAQAELAALMHQRQSRLNKEELMKRTKTHTGTFHCPSCYIEVELVNEESLKCDKCKGPLAQGSLDDLFVDEDDEDD
jgi:ribosomal protein L37AE/L43A